jgi:hypothetical protein
MGVVVNEFEALPAAPVAPAKSAGGGKDDAAKDKLEPSAVSVAMRCLETHSLRSWAH